MLNATSERRRFFRIDDNVSLSYRLIDEETANSGLKSTGVVSNEYSLAATLDVLSQEALRIMQRMEKQSPELAELYRVMDAKINAVAQAVMFVGSDVDTQKCHDVNLSASGLAFKQMQSLDVGQNLALELYLPTTLALILIYGRVVNCRVVDEQPEQYMISVDFTQVREEDQELLIKHVVRKQWQQLREDKARSESEL